MSWADEASLCEKRFRRVRRIGIDGRRSPAKTPLNAPLAHTRLEGLPLRHRGVGFHTTHWCKDRALLRPSPPVADQNNRGNPNSEKSRVDEGSAERGTRWS
jgi:hypothetical protein